MEEGRGGISGQSLARWWRVNFFGQQSCGDGRILSLAEEA